MNFTIIISLVTAAIAISTLVILLRLIKQKPEQDDSTSQLLLQRQIETINENLHSQLGKMNEQMSSRLKENAEAIHKTQSSVGERIDNAAKAYASVTNKLSKLEEANKRIEEVGKDISSLQDIFKSPKLRGGVGEHFLADLLMQTLPAGQYELQYTFKTGDRVDAIIKLRDGLIVPVDSKFPYEKIARAYEAEDEVQRKALLKGFKQDVKKHIDKIARQYILPDEGTLPMALMYIPAENVYYETIVRGEKEKSLIEYAHEQRVIPVSPNSFYIYLQTILLGLRGMQVEKKAQEILKHLGALKTDFGRFEDDYRVLGKHIGNATKTHQSGSQRLSRLNEKLTVGGGQQAVLLDEPDQEKVVDEIIGG